MSILKILRIEGVVYFDLNKETNKCDVKSNASAHSHVRLSKKEMTELIFELNELAIKMK